MKKKILFCLGLGMLVAACMDAAPDVDEDVAETEEALVCDDCDGPPTGGDPLLLIGPYQEIRPFERRCSLARYATSAYNVLGDIQPRGPLAKDIRVQVFQGQSRLLLLPVRSGGFSVTLNSGNSSAAFPGSFVTCIKNPGANTVSVDARATIATY